MGKKIEAARQRKVLGRPSDSKIRTRFLISSLLGINKKCHIPVQCAIVLSCECVMCMLNIHMYNQCWHYVLSELFQKSIALERQKLRQPRLLHCSDSVLRYHQWLSNMRAKACNSQQMDAEMPRSAAPPNVSE